MGTVPPTRRQRVFVCGRLSLLKMNEPLRLERTLALRRSQRSAWAQFKHLSSRLLVASLVSAALSLPRIVVLFLEQWSSLHFRAISPSVLATNYPSAVKALYQPHCRPFTSRPRQSRSVNENLLPTVCFNISSGSPQQQQGPRFTKLLSEMLSCLSVFFGAVVHPPPPTPKGMNRDWFWKKWMSYSLSLVTGKRFWFLKTLLCD